MKLLKIILIAILSVVLVAGLWFASIGGFAYLYALELEAKWTKANPQTRE